MKILVCIKQVPDMESRFKVNGEGTWYEDSDLAWRMNEYDEYAVEQAVQLQSQGGGAEITVLSIGPDRVKEAMKKALAMGADKGLHIQDDSSHKRDPWEIATMIANFARNEGFDLIFTGMQSQDRGSAQVGILVAQMLGIPAVSTVVSFHYDGGTVTVKRELEGGTKAVVKVPTPALFTCQLGLNTPRYPTLPNIMKAKKKELTSIPAAQVLPEPAAVVSTRALFVPQKKGGARVLEGEVPVLVTQLVGILKEKTGLVK